jgi:hypothetical protein
VEAMGYIGPLDVDERIYGWIGNPRDEEKQQTLNCQRSLLTAYLFTDLSDVVE